MRVFLYIVLIMILFSSASCGLFLDLDGDDGTTVTARQQAGTGFIGGGGRSTSPNYEFKHRINISPTDGVEKAPHYEIRPGY